MRTKHESTTRKGTKYTVNKYKLTFYILVCLFSASFAVQQDGRTVVAKNAGSVHSSRALHARVGVVAIFARNPYLIPYSRPKRLKTIYPLGPHKPI